jgi:hypothetical protein
MAAILPHFLHFHHLTFPQMANFFFEDRQLYIISSQMWVADPIRFLMFYSLCIIPDTFHFMQCSYSILNLEVCPTSAVTMSSVLSLFAQGVSMQSSGSRYHPVTGICKCTWWLHKKQQISWLAELLQVLKEKCLMGLVLLTIFLLLIFMLFSNLFQTFK